MAGYQRGNIGAGLSIAIGVPGSAGALIQVIAYFWQARTANAMKARFGRGTDGKLSFRFIRPDGHVEVRGDVPGADDQGTNRPPEPSSWEGQETTLVYQFDEEKTITWPVVIDSIDLVNVQPNSDLPGFTASLRITDKPTYSAGWGSAAAGGEVVKEDVSLYEGASLTYDVSEIASAGATVIDYWGLEADTDATVLARLQAAIAAATTPPVPGLVLRGGISHQDAPDGGVFVLNWAEKTTQEDIEFQSRKRTDATYLNPDQTVVTVSDSSTPPTVIATGGTPNVNEIQNPDDVNLELSWQDSQRITDSGKWVHTSYFDKFNHANAMIEGFKEITDDPVGFMVADDKRLTINQAATPISPPAVSGMVCVRRLIKRIGKTQYGHYFWYAFRSSVDQMTAQRQIQNYDISKISSTITAARLYRKGYDGSATAGTTGFSSASAAFVSGDVGKMITFRSPTTPNLFFNGTIATVTNGTTITISANSPLTIAGGAEYWYGPAMTAPLSELVVAGSDEPLPMVGYSDYETANPAYALRVFRFARMTHERAIEYRGTHASASNAAPQPTAGLVNIETSVDGFSPTTYADVGALAAAAHASSKNTAGFESVAVSMLTPTLSQKRVTRVNDDLTIYEAAQTVRFEKTATLAGGGTAAAARVIDSIQVATGVYRKMLGEFGQWVTYGSIILRRRKVGIVNADDVRFRGVRGSVNADAFLGYPAGTLMFMGTTQRTSWQAVIEGASHTQAYDLHFQYRSVGYWEDSQVPIGRWFLTTSTVTAGSTPALSTFGKGWSAGAPSAATFSIFLT